MAEIKQVGIIEVLRAKNDARQLAEAKREEAFRTIIYLRSCGYSFNQIAKRQEYSSNYCSILCRAFEAIKTGDYAAFARSNHLTDFNTIIDWIVKELGKDYEEVKENILAARQKADEAREIARVKTESEQNPVVHVPSDDLLVQLNSNLAFFRNLFSNCTKIVE